MSKAILEKVWIGEEEWRGEKTSMLRLDWSNDYHHAFEIPNGTPENIAFLLMEYAHQIHINIKNGEL